MCDVPSIAVFCNESIECFPGTVSKFFLKLLVAILVAPIIIGIIVHFRFHISCISIHKLLFIIIIIIIIITINKHLLTWRLNSTSANYKASTKTQIQNKTSTNTQKGMLNRRNKTVW